MGKVNFRKIIANAGGVFFSTLAGVFTADSIASLSLTLNELLLVAILPAGIQAGLVFFNQWMKEEEALEKETIDVNIPVKRLKKGKGQGYLNRVYRSIKSISLSDFITFN